jgi:hypothetical protein
MSMRITLVVTLAAAALATSASPASALSLGIGTGATLAPFQPGRTATGSGSLIVIAIGSWSLTVKDGGTGAGHMVKAATGCTGSDANLTNALTVTVPSVAGVVTSAGSKSISATATTVATGTTTILAGVSIATSYAQIIPASQAILTGCAYTLTATYTLQ